MADCMKFPNDWAKFLEDYSFMDNKEFYTNGARLIPTFRVEQMMHHYLQKTTEDSVVVVRCKDCKHWEDRNKGGCGMCWKKVTRTEEDHYCGYGEKREG